MAEPERDKRVSEAYRAMSREEPPAALDAAILAAARRRRSRWALPVSIAAVVVLAVGVTLRVQLERPEVAEPVAMAPRVLEAPAPEAKEEYRAAERSQRQRRAKEAAAPAPRGADRVEPAPAAPARLVAGSMASEPQTPEQWLERIAGLRGAGRDQEADENLAEFRRRYPDYEISAAMRARIER